MGALAALTGALTGLLVLRGLDGLGVDLTGVSAKSATATEAIGLGLSSAAIRLNIIYPPLYQVYQESYPVFEIFDL